VPNALRPICRDRDEFTAGHALPDQTLALDASPALIVICSPAATKSTYVGSREQLRGGEAGRPFAGPGDRPGSARPRRHAHRDQAQDTRHCRAGHRAIGFAGHHASRVRQTYAFQNAAEALQEFIKGREIIARLNEQFPETTYVDDLAWFDAEIAKLQPAAQPAQAVE
jgi:hypothetical protein